MKRKDELKSLREATVETLKGQVKSLNEEAMKLRFRLQSSQLPETHRLGETKRKLARVLTVLKQSKGQKKAS